MNPDRPKQEVPGDLVERLMALVRNQFCADLPGDEWGKNSHFVKRKVILWPAHYICNVKGFTVSAERYEAIMRDIFTGIKQHGDTSSIRYWPGYLMKCVQDHWKHHWEEYYRESKATLNLTTTALSALGRLPERSDSKVEAMAAAHSVLTKSSRKKQSFKAKEQVFPGF